MHLGTVGFHASCPSAHVSHSPEGLAAMLYVLRGSSTGSYPSRWHLKWGSGHLSLYVLKKVFVAVRAPCWCSFIMLRVWGHCRAASDWRKKFWAACADSDAKWSWGGASVYMSVIFPYHTASSCGQDPSIPIDLLLLMVACLVSSFTSPGEIKFEGVWRKVTLHHRDGLLLEDLVLKL
jgi:hypothetical protein